MRLQHSFLHSPTDRGIGKVGGRFAEQAAEAENFAFLDGRLDVALG